MENDQMIKPLWFTARPNPAFSFVRFIEGGEGGTGEGGEGGQGGQGEGSGGEGEGNLGDAGKKAIDAMKGERNAARQEAKDAKAELEALKAQLASKDKPAEEQALEQARREAAAEAVAKANERILRSDVKAAAAGKLQDPAMAVKLLDLSQFEANANGDFDAAQITEAIDDLIKASPYLGARGTQFDSSRSGKPPVAQLTAADLASMSPAEILKANKDGRLDHLKGKRV